MNNLRSKKLICLFAADMVGLEITKFLVKKNAIDVLVIDKNNINGLNNKIVSLVKSAGLSQVYDHDQLNDKKTQRQLKKFGPDLFILAWWPYIVGKDLLSIPKIGCLNFHPSLLPYNRGKDANFWSLKDDVPYGVSLQLVDVGVDTGPICYQREIVTTWEDTGQTLYQKATKEIVALFIENFEEILSGKLPQIRQNLSQGSFHTRKQLDPASEIKLDKKYTGRALLNLIRARTFPPHPGAWFDENGEKYQVNIKITKEV